MEFLSIDVKNLMFGLLASSMIGEQDPYKMIFSKFSEGKIAKPHEVHEFLFPFMLQAPQDE